MITKAPPEVLSPSDLAYMSTLNERDRRWFLATKAADLKTQGFSYRKVSKIMGTSTHTLQNGRQELLSGEGPGDGRIRRTGAGRKSVLPQHPEWTQAVVQIIEPHTAGLPQDENVVWISLSVTQIMNELSAIGYDISRYFVRQILDSLGLRERSFYKDLPMKDVKDRNEQFEQITAICEKASRVELPCQTGQLMQLIFYTLLKIINNDKTTFLNSDSSAASLHRHWLCREGVPVQAR